MSMNEFVAAAQPAPAPREKEPQVDPGTKPQTPTRPSPIPGKKPGTAPKPMAKAEDITQRYLNVLKGRKEPLKFNVKSIMDRYESK